jgi:hypothetical protein
MVRLPPNLPGDLFVSVIFGGELASILDDLKTRRHQADYSTVSMSDKIAQRTLDKARKLVELIGATLESTGGKR